MRSIVERMAACDEFRQELLRVVDELGPDYAELCGVPLSDVFEALVETYTPQGNERALAALWDCSPMEAFERIRVDLPRLLKRRPRLLDALTRAAGVPRDQMEGTTMDERKRNDLVRAALTKLDEIRDSIPAPEILVEYTGSVESLVLLHLVHRIYHKRIRMGLLFLARMDPEWEPVRAYLEETTRMFGLRPIEPHNEQAFQIRVWTGDSKLLEAVRDWVGPGEGGEGYRVVLRATARDRIFDCSDTFDHDGMETHIVLGDWPPEGFLAYVDWHQLEVLDAAEKATRYGQRVVAAPALEGMEPFVAAWPWNKDVPANADALVEESKEAPRLPGEEERQLAPPVSIFNMSEEFYDALVEEVRGFPEDAEYRRALQTTCRMFALVFHRPDPFPDEDPIPEPAELDKKSDDGEMSEPGEELPELADSNLGYTRDKNGRWRKDGAYIAASKVPESVKQALGGKKV